MATKYALTWVVEKQYAAGGRWRKRYKGKTYRFLRLEGETKEESYKRCWLEWLKKKDEIDKSADNDEPWRRGLNILIERTKKRLDQLRLENEDTPENRQWWNYYAGQLVNYQQDLENGVDYQFDDPDNPPDNIGGGRTEDDTPPPWENAADVPTAESLETQVKRFLQRKELQAKRGERSSGRVEVLRVGLNSFVKSCGEQQEMSAVTSAALSRFRDELESLVAEGTLKPHSARDRLQAVKQFVRWAWEEELIGLPRILQSREFSIKLPEQKIETFADAEVKRLLSAASATTKLYLLLMLNCGMTQVDIAELKQSEVDWKAGRITRKRSKTRKTTNGDKVPTVEYLLWPETFQLLKEHRSQNKELALTNANGDRLKVERFEDGKLEKKDNIRSAFNRLITKIANDTKSPLKIEKPMKLLRKTAATKLGAHADFGKFAQFFLGHAPSTVADRHYVLPDQQQFDNAVEWLGRQFTDKP